jgi:hypothetical protein
VILTWVVLAISTLFIWWNQQTIDASSAQYWCLQFIHFSIVVIGSSGPALAKRQFQRFLSAQPFPRYQNLENSLERFLDPSNSNPSSNDVLDALDQLDESIPEWCWVELIRGSLGDIDERGPYLKRLHKIASVGKSEEEYSLIAFVWSAYLIDPRDGVYRSVIASDLERIMAFSRSRFLVSGRVEPYAELALRQALESRRIYGEFAESPMMQRILQHQGRTARDLHKSNLVKS